MNSEQNTLAILTVIRDEMDSQFQIGSLIFLKPKYHKYLPCPGGEILVVLLVDENGGKTVTIGEVSRPEPGIRGTGVAYVRDMLKVPVEKAKDVFSVLEGRIDPKLFWFQSYYVRHSGMCTHISVCRTLSGEKEFPEVGDEVVFYTDNDEDEDLRSFVFSIDDKEITCGLFDDNDRVFVNLTFTLTEYWGVDFFIVEKLALDPSTIAEYERCSKCGSFFVTSYGELRCINEFCCENIR